MTQEKSDDPTDEIQVLDKLVDRNGAMAMVGIVNLTSKDAMLGGASLICQGIFGGLEGVDDDWLFGVPLWCDTRNDRIRPGANVFPLSIMGYQPCSTGSGPAEKHFKYVFTMLHTRGPELAAKISKPEDRTEFVAGVSGFGNALKNALEMDVPSQFPALRSFDKYLKAYIEVSVLTPSGSIWRSSVNLSSRGLIFWLANYL